MQIYFSDYFEVSEQDLDEHGAFNVSLVTDLPLFVDPFLLFGSEKPEYRNLHDAIIRYLRFLKSKSEQGGVTRGDLAAWYFFSEVRQNWLGFCGDGNRGRGLGVGFARALDSNLVHVFQNFGNEQVTRGSHLEKLTLIRAGVGRDMISDFTTNLIKEYLLEFTQAFAVEHIDRSLLADVSVPRVRFDYDLGRWMPKKYTLPMHEGDFVLLTPKDILTKDDTWISHADMLHRFEDIPDAIGNDQLRAEINAYFFGRIPEEEPTKEDVAAAMQATLARYPELIDYYIRMREDAGEDAVAYSASKVDESQRLYVDQFGGLAQFLATDTGFYDIAGNTHEETRQRIEFFKDVIENKGGHRIFFDSEQKPIRRESDVQILFRLVWFATPSDVSREVNDGRGPVDFKVTRGAADKCMVEFKLASNTKLKQNLEKQLAIYQKAGDTPVGFKVIVYFTEDERRKVDRVLDELDMANDPLIVLIDARSDNKPSGSMAKG